MNAIIYVRVSSVDQVEGTSLDSQELACREYAQKHDLGVERIFIEQGESAKFAHRTQLLQLLDYCKGKNNNVSTLIVWKLDRFARNVEDHFAIKAKLRGYGVSVVSVTEPIAGDPNGKLMETILAGFAAFDNDIRAIRSIQGLQQRIREGLFPWKPPLGYLPPKLGRKTEPDRPDPKRFPFLQKAWQLFASGAYRKADIVRLLRTWGVVSYRGGFVSAQMLDFMFRNPFYAGVVRNPWTGDDHHGRHVPMVSPGEFAIVQRLVAERNNSQPHNRASENFPLRGIVRCPTCQCHMTGALSKGRQRKYAYYSCWQRTCPTRTRSYPAQDVHNEFISFISTMTVPLGLCEATFGEILEALADERQTVKSAIKNVADDIRGIDRKVAELITMRAGKLITDDEYLLQRTALQRQRREVESVTVLTRDRWFSEPEQRDLTASFQDFYGLWYTAPNGPRRGFEELLFPVGYMFRNIRTAERGLLFRVFTRSGDSESNEAALITTNLNQLMSELSKFLVIFQSSQEAASTPKKAA